jgi:hypothetical protein
LPLPPGDECFSDTRAASQDGTVLRAFSPVVNEFNDVLRIMPSHAVTHASHDFCGFRSTRAILTMLNWMRQNAEHSLIAILPKPRVQSTIPRHSTPEATVELKDAHHRVEEACGNENALRAEEGGAFPDGVRAANDGFLVRDAPFDLPTEMFPHSCRRVVQVQVRDGIEADSEIECPWEQLLIDVDVILDVQGRESFRGSVREGFMRDDAVLLRTSGIAGAEENEWVKASLPELRDGACPRCLPNAAGCHDGEDVSHGTPNTTILARATVIAALLV